MERSFLRVLAEQFCEMPVYPAFKVDQGITAALGLNYPVPGLTDPLQGLAYVLVLVKTFADQSIKGL